MRPSLAKDLYDDGGIWFVLQCQAVRSCYHLHYFKKIKFGLFYYIKIQRICNTPLFIILSHIIASVQVEFPICRLLCTVKIQMAPHCTPHKVSISRRKTEKTRDTKRYIAMISYSKILYRSSNIFCKMSTHLNCIKIKKIWTKYIFYYFSRFFLKLSCKKLHIPCTYGMMKISISPRVHLASHFDNYH